MMQWQSYKEINLVHYRAQYFIQKDWVVNQQIFTLFSMTFICIVFMHWDVEI